MHLFRAFHGNGLIPYVVSASGFPPPSITFSRFARRALGADCAVVVRLVCQPSPGLPEMQTLPQELRIPDRERCWACLSKPRTHICAGIERGKMILRAVGNAQTSSPDSGVPGNSETVQAERFRSRSVAESEACLGLFQCPEVSGPIH